MRPPQRKENDPTIEGKCPYCKKYVKSLKHHLHDKHLEIPKINK